MVGGVGRWGVLVCRGVLVGVVLVGRGGGLVGGGGYIPKCG